MINFTARIKNKTFWLTLIPAVLLLVQVVAAPFGVPVGFRRSERAVGRDHQRAFRRARDSGHRDRPDHGGRWRFRASAHLHRAEAL